MEITEKEKEEINKLSEHKFLGMTILNVEQNKNINVIEKRYIYSIIKLLNKKEIDRERFRNLLSKGNLDSYPSLRSLSWKFLLDYINNKTDEWENYLDNKRNYYNNEKEKHIKKISHIKFKTHPLDIQSNSNYSGYLKDNHLTEIIDKDIKRTRTDEIFFSKKVNSKNKETHYDIIKRILFFYAKLHPDIGYVQGFNEILATIYYCYSKDKNLYFKEGIEADSFYCLEKLINLFPEIYIASKDYDENGIRRKINYIKFILYVIDYEMFSNLRENKIDIYMFLFRWFSLFFSQEFSLESTMKIWDYLFCQNNIEQYLNILCLSALRIKRKLLCSKQISDIMMALQDFNDNDVNAILDQVDEISVEIENKNSRLTKENFYEFLKIHCK
jgi:hypothetical protein